MLQYLNTSILRISPWFTVAITIFCYGELFAQNIDGSGSHDNKAYLVENFNVALGLSDYNVTSILQDQRGYIWIGTYDGLNRYDGYRFTVFKHQPGNANSLSHNKINAIHEDSVGNLWIATDGGLNYYDQKIESFKSYQHDAKDPNSISHDRIRSIFEDQEGQLWLGTFTGLNRFDRETEQFTLYQHSATHVRHWEDEPAQEIAQIGELDAQHLIVGYWGMGMMIFDKKSHRFEQIQIDNDVDPLRLTTDWIAPEHNGIKWLVASGGLYTLSNQKKLHSIFLEFIPYGEEIRGFIPTETGKFIVLTTLGFYILDQDLKPIQYVIPDEIDPITPQHNLATAAILDNTGDIWVGTQGSGLFHLISKRSHFLNFEYDPDQKMRIPHHYVNAILEIEEDQFWIGTRRHGIHVFDKNLNSFSPLPKHIDYPIGLNTKEISVLYKDSKDRIWIGTWGKSVIRYDPQNKSFTYLLDKIAKTKQSFNRFITNISELQNGDIWIGTVGGLIIYKEGTEYQNPSISQVSIFNGQPNDSPYAYTLHESKDGQIYVGSKLGLHKYIPSSQTFITYQNHIDSTNTIINNWVNCIYEDSKGRFWIGTAGGLDLFDIESETFIHTITATGSGQNFINSIIEDKQGNLWLGTKSGISRFHPETKHINHYNLKDGLLNFDINQKAFVQSRNGETILAGGKNGLTVFDPSGFDDNKFIPPVIISSLKKYNKSKGKTIESFVPGIGYMDQVDLNYRDNILVFELTALNFQNAKKNEYAYLLDGFTERWIPNGTKREITFTNLDPGTYTLKVRGSNNDGIWNEEGSQLTIKIKPPWWETKLAYLLYFTMLSGIIYMIFYFVKRRIILKNELQHKDEEAARLLELDNFKSRLYTNITHEFRTPLTVILGMVDQIKSKPKKYLSTGLNLIKQNGENLLFLINQLLDLSKLENKSLKLNLIQDDIVQYTRYLTESFQTFANGKNLALRFFSSAEECIMDYDPEQIKQIFRNLISNAIKFTGDGGEIQVKVSEQTKQLKIQFIDNGIGIASNHLDLIFDRFYQEDANTNRKNEGTGIGLAHTKELVQLMQGDIKVQSEPGKGSTFTVLIPINNKAHVVQPKLEEIKPSNNLLRSQNGSTGQIEHSNGNSLNEKDQPIILLIEDNHDVVYYLKTCLTGKYHIITAFNGKIGIEKAMVHIPDVIISDVMMPEKDGYEVCQVLKNDIKTSHIPIILLTAKVDEDSKIKGLKRGADAYLSKPFNKEELLVRMDKLIVRNARLRNYFAKNHSSLQDNDLQIEEIVKVEDAFLRKMEKIVSENYTDELFGLPILCKKIHMSRSQIFRKMKALTGDSPSQFIREYRLKKAADLLKSGELNISEVAWEVGFKDPSYFSKAFRDTFGILPSEVNRQ